MIARPGRGTRRGPPVRRRKIFADVYPYTPAGFQSRLDFARRGSLAVCALSRPHLGSGDYAITVTRSRGLAGRSGRVCRFSRHLADTKLCGNDRATGEWSSFAVRHEPRLDGLRVERCGGRHRIHDRWSRDPGGAAWISLSGDSRCFTTPADQKIAYAQCLSTTTSWC